MYPKIDENKSTVANAEYLRKAGITDSAEQKAIIELINKTSKSEDDYLKLHAMLVYNAKHDVDAVKAKNMIAAGKTAGTVAATT